MQSQSTEIRVLVTPDKFRGSLNASQICDAVQQGLKQLQKEHSEKRLQIKIEKLNLADGGQGSLQVVKKYADHSVKIDIVASDPLFRPIKTYYLVDEVNSIAYIEMAKVSGLSLLEQQQRNPMLTTTYGVGQIIADCLNIPLKKIYLFIGGSATNDAGIGMANALGYKFLNHQGEQLQPIGKNLINIHQIVEPPKELLQKIVKTDISVLTDVKNVFFGQNGAAYIYGPQKGASQNQVQELDKGLRNLNEIFKTKYSKDLSNVQGTGAAGGLGGGGMMFLYANLSRGIEKVMQIIHFEQTAQKSDIIITGQGKLDKQSLEGKVIYGVMKEAKKFSKPLWILCGINELQIESDLLPFYSDTAVISLVDNQTTQEQAMKNTKQTIKRKIKQKFRTYLENKIRK